MDFRFKNLVDINHTTLHGKSELGCHDTINLPIAIDPKFVLKLPRLILFVFHDTTTTDDRRPTTTTSTTTTTTTTPRPTKDHDDDDDDETRSAIDLFVDGSQNGPRKV